MREPPDDLSQDLLAAGLHAQYGLAVTALTFLPLGQDSSAWVYRVQTADDAAYFLKVRTSVSNVPGLLVPRFLQDHGIAPVVAPLPTLTGALWAAVAGYALILYPFIAGSTGMAHGMEPSQWIAYGAILRQIHTTPITTELAQCMQRETFVPAGAATVRTVHAYLGGQIIADPVVQDFTPLWQERWDTIQTLVTRAEELGQWLAQRAPRYVLCHADIHTNNVLLDSNGAVRIVDWDDTILAPQERDLMFVVGGGLNRTLVGSREEDLFFQGYGATILDPLALTYYRYALAVRDMGEYSEQVVLRRDLGSLTRRLAVDRFLIMFQPGRIVGLALTTS